MGYTGASSYTRCDSGRYVAYDITARCAVCLGVGPMVVKREHDQHKNKNDLSHTYHPPMMCPPPPPPPPLGGVMPDETVALFPPRSNELVAVKVPPPVNAIN